jgi:protein-S-isoprenylcysteine O-methyltransferase Ste14
LRNRLWICVQDLFYIVNLSFCMSLRHLISITTLPVTVIIVIPIALVNLLYHEPFWRFHSLFQLLLVMIGLFLMSAGVVLLSSSISLFIKRGNGTIAPWNPTSKLIVSGVYGHVRNPMITGVTLSLIGESILLGSIPVTIWTLLFVLTNLIYVPLIEESKLAERFGDEYLVYKENVPRWIPRLSRWKKD